MRKQNCPVSAGRHYPAFGPTPEAGFPPLPWGEGSKAANLGKCNGPWAVGKLLAGYTALLS